MDVEAKYGEYEPYDLWWKMEEKLGSCNELMLVQVVACIGNVSNGYWCQSLYLMSDW